VSIDERYDIVRFLQRQLLGFFSHKKRHVMKGNYSIAMFPSIKICSNAHKIQMLIAMIREIFLNIKCIHYDNINAFIDKLNKQY